mmetsp:Transcript_11943/g.22124  ORF Transcript_11943/g.22124 Transcript_11943/m.22124 type:complete len:313 (-) Transcript_11943:331-1269(-)
MSQGQIRNKGFLSLSEVYIGCHSRNTRYQMRMLHDNSLGLSGRTTGVHDDCHIGRLGWSRIVFVLLAHVHDIVERHNLDLGFLARGGTPNNAAAVWRHFVLRPNNGGQTGHILGTLVKGFDLFPIDHECRGLGFIDGQHHRVGTQGGITRCHHHTLRHGSLQRCGPFFAGLFKNNQGEFSLSFVEITARSRWLGFHAHLAQSFAKGTNLLAQLLVGHLHQFFAKLFGWESIGGFELGETQELEVLHGHFISVLSFGRLLDHLVDGRAILVNGREFFWSVGRTTGSSVRLGGISHRDGLHDVRILGGGGGRCQ